jgi:hypothetical protein
MVLISLVVVVVVVDDVEAFMELITSGFYLK